MLERHLVAIFWTISFFGKENFLRSFPDQIGDRWNGSFDIFTLLTILATKIYDRKSEMDSAATGRHLVAIS